MEAALDLHRRAVAAEPRLAVAHHNHGFVLQRMDNIDPACAAYRLALTFAPQEAATWMNLGHALRSAGHGPDALDVFRIAAELRPDLRDPLIEIAKIGRSYNRWELALDAYKRMEKLTPDDSFVANEAGACLFGMNRMQEARPYFVKATELDPNSPWGYANRSLPRTRRTHRRVSAG